MAWIEAKTVEGWDCIINADEVLLFAKPSPLAGLPSTHRTLAVKQPGLPPLGLDVLYDDVVDQLRGPAKIVTE